MKQLNGYWIGKNGNKWSTSLFDEEGATKAEMSCRNCQDCRNCQYCQDCQYCRDCRDCQDCRNCRNCQYCQYCQYCQDCRDFTKDPDRLVINNIGSRSGVISIYWYCDMIQVVCGCFRGSLLEFEKAVIKTHGDNEHGIRYQQVIRQAWEIMSC